MKFFEEKIFRFLMIVATLVVFGFVISIIWTIASRGWGAMSWDMITKLPGGGFYIGKEGGFLNAIVGSLYIVGASTILGLLISIPVVFYLNVYLKKKSKFAYIARLAYDILFGIPSIVYGAFGFTIMIYLGLRTSLAGGIIVITLLIIPIFIRSMDEIAREFPRDILDTTYSLGATRYESMRVVLRQIAPGIATATLLSVGRAIGDAAAVMFTAGYTDSIPTSLSQPAATLPLAVFFQLSSPVKEVQDRAYAAALVLTLIVLILSIAGRFITNRFSKNKLQ
ncbi:phosphate transport system permease protein PstA [Odoribacter laneus]|jgi:phosphate ABC transporter, permease protein pstA|uniref:Phosphate ABC transporter, permease PstA n=1 Tax=Odoribacter laneus YIT 12061 TaxID=742817 RepID=H1DJV7_9BACT|nr:ABC transporter permease subunit [Odoribacter laneus]EHP45957.1 phosphate ABC transporter, permease PstA [Odoribacter laneus YIT 12061]GKI23062.1 phosphate transport system permease protein PstA [Odoribacter laneus]GKI26648.1 phosphate transport system permease protein PstA [Odoribacter laneus]CCZ82354.1 phosphate ABC transporter permease PstA [Odoribacter laneus CAG:561]